MVLASRSSLPLSCCDQDDVVAGVGDAVGSALGAVFGSVATGTDIGGERAAYYVCCV